MPAWRYISGGLAVTDEAAIQNVFAPSPGRQQVAEPCRRRIRYNRSRSTYSVLYSPLYMNSEVEAGNHIGRKLSEIGILERCPGVLIPAAPTEPRREAAPQRGVAEQAAPAAVEGCLVRG